VIAKGEPWGRPASGPADEVVSGDDRALAAAVREAPGALIRFRPDPQSDLACAVGLAGTVEHPPPAGTELPMDTLVLTDGAVAVNMVVVGMPPEGLRRSTRRVAVRIRVDGRDWLATPCTTVVLAVGQWRGGLDLVPRGHPGDGRAEIQAYSIRPGERRAFRHRLRSGDHLPHPDIHTTTARHVEIAADSALSVEVDGVAQNPSSSVVAEVRSHAYRLLV
jgi:hypothetical protein